MTRASGVAHKYSSTFSGSIDYSYDDQGRLTSVTSQSSQNGSTTYAYSYDGQGRVTKMSITADGAPAPSEVDLSYDGAPSAVAGGGSSTVGLVYVPVGDPSSQDQTISDINAFVTDPTPRDPASSTWFYDRLPTFRS